MQFDLKLNNLSTYLNPKLRITRLLTLALLRFSMLTQKKLSSQKKNETFSFPILDFSDIEKIYFKSTFIIFGKESHRASYLNKAEVVFQQ